MLFVYFWAILGGEHTHLWKKTQTTGYFIVVPLLSPLSYRKWCQMKGIKVDSYWKNQSCCISKGIPLVFRSLSLISPHSSGELNHSLLARYWPNGFLAKQLCFNQQACHKPWRGYSWLSSSFKSMAIIPKLSEKCDSLGYTQVTKHISINVQVSNWWEKGSLQLR